MKKSTSVLVTIPSELLPDVLELVTDSYTRMQGTLDKNARTISDLEFKVSELKNKLKHQQQMQEAENGDDF